MINKEVINGRLRSETYIQCSNSNTNNPSELDEIGDSNKIKHKIRLPDLHYYKRGQNKNDCCVQQVKPSLTPQFTKIQD